MKILAVIPARAGSKGIPNKNIRIIGGQPLIYYSIKNALDSKYITDVIISTDSPEVRIIATQMGTKYKWRDKSLCGDDVTLDSVVYDAVPKDEQWDYVVTMQPTSPTLKVAVLRPCPVLTSGRSCQEEGTCPVGTSSWIKMGEGKCCLAS